MHLPTNKLRDLIAVLQTFDQDVETDIEAASMVIGDGGKRVLKLDQSKTLLTEEDFMDKLCALIDDGVITDDFYSLQGAANAIKQFYAASIKLKDIQGTIDDVAADLKYAASRLLDLEL